MPSSEYHRRQAEIFDRVADQCTVSLLVEHYRALARQHREMAASGEGDDGQNDAGT